MYCQFKLCLVVTPIEFFLYKFVFLLDEISVHHNTHCVFVFTILNKPTAFCKCTHLDIISSDEGS